MKKFSLLLMAIGLVVSLLCNTAYAKSVVAAENPDNPLHLWVPYDPEKSSDLNKLDTKYIFIQDKDLEEIKNSKNPEKSDSGEPPISYQITSVDYFADVKNDQLKIKGIYKINKLDDEWALVPVISDKIGISSASLGGKSAFITTVETLKKPQKFKNYNRIQTGNHVLVLKDKGSHILTVNFTENIVKAPSQNIKSFFFGLPKIPIINLICQVDEKGISFQIPDAVSIETIKTATGVKVAASLPPVETIKVQWTPKSTAIKDSAKQNLPPSASAVTYSRIEVGRGALKGTFSTNIDIRRSPLSYFEFYVPEDIEIDSIYVKDNELVDPYPDVKDNILPLELVTPVEGKVRFVIYYRKNFDDSSFKSQIPAITLVNDNIDRETGYVGVVETTNIESSVLEANDKKNYREIDSNELEGDLKGLKASIALKYIKNKEEIKQTPYDITINVVRHKDVAVYEANITSTNITSIINKEGSMFTKALLQVRNTGKQFLEVALPENSSVWSVYVDKKSVKPALKDDKKGIYAIPLAKSASSDVGGKSFPVEIVYFTDNVLPTSVRVLGATNLKAMTTELVSNSVKWNIYMPKDTDFVSLSAFSNLIKDKTTYHRRSNQSPFGGMQKHAQILNQNMADSVMEAEEQMAPSGKGDYDYKKSKEKSGWSRGAYSPQKAMPKQVYKSKKVGKLPVYVNLPLVGQSYKFYQLSFEADKLPSVFALYSNSIIIEFLSLILLALLIYILHKRHKLGDHRSFKFIIPLVISIGLLYELIGLNIIWILVITGVLRAIKKKVIKPLKLPEFKLKNILITVGVLFLLFISLLLLMEMGIARFVILTIGLTIIGGLLFAAVMLIKFLMGKFSDKGKTQKPPELDDKQDVNVEGSN